MASPRRGLTCRRDGLSLNEIDAGNLGGPFTLLSPTEKFQIKLPADNVLHNINMQRRQEDLGFCLTSLAMKKRCTGSYHRGDGRKRHKTTNTISRINIGAFYTLKPFQANYFFSFH